jgi:hypothetical protein
MISFHTTLHVTGYNGSVISAIKNKHEEHLDAGAVMLFHIP